jgi:large subunit ribosomal protein L22
MAYQYSVELTEEDEDVTAKALGKDRAIKPKHALNVADTIRGMDLEDARDRLEAVIEKEEPIAFNRHQEHTGHRKGDTEAGQFPVRASEGILEVLENAEANAEYKGLDPAICDLWHIAIQRTAPDEGTMPRAQGRATSWDKEKCHVEVVLREREA